MRPREKKERQEGQLTELRRILLGPAAETRERLEKVEERLDDPHARAEDISRVLPQAMLLRAKRDKALTQALGEPVAEAIESSVRRDPKPIVDAIFPVIGPAIRKAIGHALSSMVQQFNRAVEHSLSPKALLWRLEAWRTGRSFGEVVLLKTLVYRVEQVFLIHRENGLLLQQVIAPEAETRDADMVSAMLTAIQDFVRDSFSAGEEEAMESLQVGDHHVWVEQGRAAVLAAVIRGQAPEELRTRMQTALEAIERDMGGELAHFDGDASSFGVTRPRLETCLGQASRRKRSEIVPLLTFFAALGIVLWLGYLYFESRVERNRWESYLARLDEEPGLVVTGQAREDGRFVVRGLRDPLARRPEELLGELDAGDVKGHWRPYQALEPELVSKRATRTLAPPESVRLTLEAETLVAKGPAPHGWIESFHRIAPALPGVTRADGSGLTDRDQARFDRLKAQVDPRRGATAVARMLKELLEAAAALDREPSFELRGKGAGAFAGVLAREGVPAELIESFETDAPLALKIRG